VCSDIVVTNNIKIPGREQSPEKIPKGMLCIEGQDQKKGNFCDQSPSLLLAEPHTVSKELSTGSIPVLPRLAGLAGFPVPQGNGRPRKQRYFLATKAVEPQPAPRRAGSSAPPDPGALTWDAGNCLGSCGGNHACCPSAAARQGSDCWILLPEQVLSNKMRLYRSLVKSLKKAAKI